MPDNPKLRKNGGEGTAAGNFLRSINFSKVAEVIGNIATGDIKSAIQVISKSDSELTDAQREHAIALIQLEIETQKAVTGRWTSDSNSGYWLPANIRPLTLIFLSVSTILLIISDSLGWDFNVDGAWIDTLKSMLLTVYGAYFLGRSAEKIKKL